MPSSYEQLVFEIFARDMGASQVFDKFGRKVDATSASISKNTALTDRSLLSWAGLAARASTAGTALGGAAGPTGMGAAIAAGVALSPVVVTLGTGLAGLGLAAFGTAKNTQVMAQVMGRLRPEIAAFSKSLQPEVLGVFNQGVRLAGHLLSDIAPVSRATGIALGQVLGAIDAEFRSGTWQNFFAFMARTAAPDMRLLGASFVNLLDAAPRLVQMLQPLAQAMLVVTVDATKSADAITAFVTAAEHKFPLSTQNTFSFIRSLDRSVVDLTNHIPGARAINDWLTGVQHGLSGAAASAPGAASGIGRTATAAQAAAAQVQAMATATRNLMTAQANALGLQTAYGASMVTSANDAVALEKALDHSKGKIGLQAQAQRDSFAAANTYINDLSAQATAAQASGHGVDGAIRAIRNGLPVLDSAKTKNKQYWQEVQALVGWLDKLATLKAIHEAVFVTGSGTWTIRPGTSLGLPGGSAGGPFAAGGLVTGGVPGKDSRLILAMPGEAVVPTHLVGAIAPFLKAHGVPGFASGGLIPSYGGSVGGLPPWGTHDLNAMVAIFEQAVAKATLAGMKAAAATAAASAAGPAISGGGGPAAALFQRMYPAWATGALWAAVNYVAMRESGWSTTAVNPSSGAAGVAQRIQGWAPFYQPGNAFQQDKWFHDYMLSRYGGPLGAAAHERAFNWYDTGGTIYEPVVGVGRSGRMYGFAGSGPETVLPDGLLRAVLAELKTLNAHAAAMPGRTGAATADALNGTARGAYYQGHYSTRG